MNRIATIVAGLSLAFVGTSTTIAGTINVPGDYKLIQDAIDASSDGDVINIAPGTYIEKIITNGGKSLTIQGTLNSDGSLATTIDAQGSSTNPGTWGEHIFDLSTPNGLVVLKNLELTGGYANYGGAVHFKNGSLTLDGCHIHGNYTRVKGTIGRAAGNNSYCLLTMKNCIFENNNTDRSPTYSRSSIAYYNGDLNHPNDLIIQDCQFRNGMGMARLIPSGEVLIERCTVSGIDPYLEEIPTFADESLLYIRDSSVTIRESSFEDNRDGRAIEMYRCDNILIDDVTINNNVMNLNNVSGGPSGGGIDLWECNNVAITNCEIANNTSWQGGGISARESDVSMDHCTIKNNTATGYFEPPFSYPAQGGGISARESDVSIDHCTISNNTAGDSESSGAYPAQGGGLMVDGGEITITSSQFYENLPGNYALFTDLISISGDFLSNNGACCLGGTCMTGTEANCTAAGGSYAGNDVACADANCVTATPGDVDGDGDVDTNDLSSLRSSLALCASDTDADGDTDIEDLLNVVAGWGTTCP